MKSVVAGVCCLMGMAISSHGQQFAKCWQESLSEPLNHVQLEWVALDNDTLLDVVLAGQTAAGELKLVSYQNTITGLKEKNALATGFRDGIIQLADWNHDNRVDVLISGRTLTGGDAVYVFENNTNFTFTKATTPLLDQAGLFRMVDFNADGRADLLMAGTQGPDDVVRVYQNVNDRLLLVYDSLNVSVTDLAIADFNQDGFPDFVLSGEVAAAPAILLFVTYSSFRFKASALQNPLSGQLSAIDQNEDGKVDLFAVGFVAGNGILSEWRNDSISLIPHQSYPAPRGASLFTGDMNSDGLADRLLSGTDNLGNKISYVQDSSLLKIPLDTTGLVVQKAGDFDRDGDLDVLQVMDSAGREWIKILRNRTFAKNRRPANAGFAFAISTSDRTFLYWDRATDDHDSLSLTYDVWLGTKSANVQTADFDLGTGRRLTVTHGNAGTQNGKIFRGLTDNRYFYKIQTVDNAYNGSYSSFNLNGEGGVCSGGVASCFDLAHEYVQACRGEAVVLRAVSNAYWFSLARGLLATDTVYRFMAGQNDTIFSFVPQQNDCSKNKIWTIGVHNNNNAVSESETVYACKDKDRKFGIAPGWKNVVWNTNPQTSGVDTVSLLINKDLVLVAKGTSANGCSYQKEFNIKLSEPALELNGDVFRVLKGNRVQLEAVSSANQFLWVPPDGLNSTTISSPLAQPSQTTDYTVTATDAFGCTAKAKVRVEVEEVAFIPNLFTPNGDGINDRLLVYGLTQATDFKFRIYNREGVLVYETSDPVQVSTTGWNGYASGPQQPNGVYYWKVEGTDNVGEAIHLNGKTMGSILLVH